MVWLSLAGVVDTRGFPLPYLGGSNYLPLSLQTPTCHQADTPPSFFNPNHGISFFDFRVFFQHLLCSFLQAEESELNEHHSEQLVAYMRWWKLPSLIQFQFQSWHISLVNLPSFYCKGLPSTRGPSVSDQWKPLSRCLQWFELLLSRTICILPSPLLLSE